MVIDTAQGGERGGTLAGEAQTVYRRSFPCWYKQTPEAASSGGLGAAATNKHAARQKILCKRRQVVVKETGANQRISRVGHNPA